MIHAALVGSNRRCALLVSCTNPRRARMAKVLITGTSSGIGLATALELGRAGHQVHATMRNPARAPELGERVAQEKLPISILTMDVDSDSSVVECFAAVPHIDVLVN